MLLSHIYVSFQKGTVAHEVGHVIGFWHEHARPDRDDYIKIIYNNVFMSEYYNFHKRTWAKMDNLGVPYDIGSLMHYSGEVRNIKNVHITVFIAKPV